MTNNWAVAIGINQYQFFQPLGCAQADAEALKEYLVSEVGFLPEQCVLMTDTSPTFADMSTYPTKENILLLLENLAAKSWQPHDQVWFFFSGYGVNQDGQDYLMPVEGHPDLVVTTGIDIRGLLQSLQVVRTDILVLLDINRAFGTQANAYVGKETLEVAKELPVPTILSCQSEQFSYESSELGHGFFTAALIEALRSQNANTVGQLANYLGTRIPELCQHHWRPTQNPAIAIPNNEQVILPKLRLVENNQPHNQPNNQPRQPLVTPRTAEEVIFLGESQPAPKLEESSMISGTEAQKKQGEVPPLISPPSSFSSSELSSVKEPKSESTAPDKATTNNTTNKQEEKKATTSSSGKNLLLWLGAGMMFLSLIVALVFRNLAGSRDTEQFQASPNTTTNENRRAVRRVPNFTTPQRRANSSAGGSNSQNNRQDNDSQDNNSQDNTSQDNNRQENQLPASTIQPLQEKRALAELAKMSKNPNQANDLSEAIAQARRIKPGVRGYEQAQENIQVWSRMILDLAEERMKQGQFPQAIAAAQLLTREDPLYQQAQEAINQWRPSAKQFLSNKTLIDAATALVRPRQASTYNRAIEVAKRVPQGEAGYELAQKSINQWSQQILDIANARAAAGDLKSAISTATLVPEGTSAYNKAQDAIQKWQKR